MDTQSHVLVRGLNSKMEAETCCKAVTQDQQHRSCMHKCDTGSTASQLYAQMPRRAHVTGNVCSNINMKDVRGVHQHVPSFGYNPALTLCKNMPYYFRSLYVNSKAVPSQSETGLRMEQLWQLPPPAPYNQQ